VLCKAVRYAGDGGSDNHWGTGMVDNLWEKGYHPEIAGMETVENESLSDG